MPDNQLLGVLTREGVLINVSVRYWRAAKKLNAEDLGLDPDDVTTCLISLGHKKLLPRDALARFALLESRAHALVEASTFPFLNGLGHFLPNAKLKETTDKLKSLEIEFIQAQAAFLREYGALRQSALREWNGRPPPASWSTIRIGWWQPSGPPLYGLRFPFHSAHLPEEP